MNVCTCTCACSSENKPCRRSSPITSPKRPSLTGSTGTGHQGGVREVSSPHFHLTFFVFSVSQYQNQYFEVYVNWHYT